MQQIAVRVALVVTLFCGGCAGASSPTPTGSPTTPAAEATGAGIPVTLEPPGGGANVELLVEDAHEPESRRTGLMFRRRLPERSGMVFRYAEDHTGGFWMKNTLIPLSIAFFGADGTVRAVLDMEPCKADPCPSYDPAVTYRGALEVNQGLFERAGVRPGWRVRLPRDLPPPS